MEGSREFPDRRRAWAVRIAFGLARLVALLMLTALGGLALMRFAPGFAADDRRFDLRYSSETLAALDAEKASGYWDLAQRFAVGICAGDLGISESLGYPVAELIRDRAPDTLWNTGAGVAMAWAVALAAVCLPLLTGNRWFDTAALSANQVLLVLPSGLIAFVIFARGLPVWTGIAVVVFPQVFRYARELAANAWANPHVLAASARGSSRWRLLVYHAAPNLAPALVAVTGTSVAIGFGASIPVESLADFPGLGQLTWKAALARDLPLLLPMSLLVAAVTLTANWFADLLLVAFRAQRQDGAFRVPRKDGAFDAPREEREVSA